MRCVCGMMLVLAVAGTAFALPTDREQPVRIESERAEIDDHRRTAVYEGDVVITQGSLRIEGERVTMHLGESYDLQKLVAEGKAARFQQQPESGGALHRASAERIEYDLVRNTMLLRGNARLSQGEDYTMSAAEILYDAANASIRGEAASPGSSEGRVTITIAPGRISSR